MKRCLSCVNPITRPNVIFDKNHICLACKKSGKKHSSKIDWAKRRKQLQTILDKNKKNNNETPYDCIVTVSGGKDSFRQAFFARDELNLNPLLVCVQYPPEELHERGAKNLETLIKHGFETVSMSLNPIVWKKLLKKSFFENGNIHNTAEMALYAIPIHISISYKIPLVFLGENPSHTLGEKHGGIGADASQMYKSNTLAEGRSLMKSLGLKKKDAYFYNYPSEDDFRKSQTKIFYLGNFIKDWSGRNNADFAISKGLKTRIDKPENIGDLWGVSAVDEEFRLVNQFLKFLKFGFGHVTDQVQERIHSGKMNRKEGLNLIKKYDGKLSYNYIMLFCDYLEIEEKKFWQVANKFKNKDIFKQKISKSNFRKLKYEVDSSWD